MLPEKESGHNLKTLSQLLGLFAGRQLIVARDLTGGIVDSAFHLFGSALNVFSIHGGFLRHDLMGVAREIGSRFP